MVLNCLCPWNGSFNMVSWTGPRDHGSIAVYHPEHGYSFSHHYKDRIEFLRKSDMDGSISITNVTHQDIGSYRCSVQTFPRGSWSRTIQVEDLGNRSGKKSEGRACVGWVGVSSSAKLLLLPKLLLPSSFPLQIYISFSDKSFPVFSNPLFVQMSPQKKRTIQNPQPQK